MTPLLVLAFGVPPLAAVSSDLAASAVMKPFGGWVHARRGTVNWALVRWLCLGSIPSAFLGVLLLRLIPDEAGVQRAIQVALGAALVLAALGLVAKAYSGRRRRGGGAGPGDHGAAAADGAARRPGRARRRPHLGRLRFADHRDPARPLPGAAPQ